MASLVSPGTTRGEHRFAPCVERFRARRQNDRNWMVAPNQPSGAGEQREGFMTYQISQRGKQYQKNSTDVAPRCSNYD